MFYHLKIILRNLRRDGVYSLLNIAGLCIGLTACIFIVLWVQNELSYDRFHRNAQQLYRVNAAIMDDVWTSTPVQAARIAVENCPGVADACRIAEYYSEYVEYDNRKFFDAEIRAVDNNMLSVFDFVLKSGNREAPFPDDLSMIITERKAVAIFGDEDPMGKVLKNSEGLLFHITGVIENPPANSSLQFDYLVPRLTMQRTFGGNGQWKHIDDDWGNFRYETFLLLERDTDVSRTAELLSKEMSVQRNSIETNGNGKFAFQLSLQPLTELHLYDPNREGMSGIRSIWLLIVITLFILAIACINYVNMVTARAAKRMKEIAVRKITGAARTCLFFQLVQETVVMLAVSFAIATVMIWVLMPAFGYFTGKELAFSLGNPAVWMLYGILGGCSLLFAGIYPAAVLSSFHPMDAFRGSAGGRKRGAGMRRGLVVLQFAVSFILMVITIGLSSQIRYMQEKDMGYDGENIFTMIGRNMSSHYDAIRSELLASGYVADVSMAGMRDMYVNSRRGGCYWEGKPDDLETWIFNTHVHHNFLDVMGMELVAGENFAPTDTFALLINEELARMMNTDNPVGQLFYMNKEDSQGYTIKGVVKNFHFQRLNQKIGPMMLRHPISRYGNFYIRTKPGVVQGAVEAAGSIWAKYNPDRDFAYHFLDDSFARDYKDNIYMQRLLILFSAIAILISCLGLFGLVTYMAELRTKEIGIRKVLGAGTGSIIVMLSKEFLVLSGIGIAIALPVVYYGLHRLLQDYAYHIALSWWIFASGIAVMLAMTLLSVLFRAASAANANPARSIKVE
jgi:ABC-type antimicrobial peptide transport system permease subunit